MQLLCSIQYRVVKENADDAFYELQNPQEQIQAYVFDGLCFDLVFVYNSGCFSDDECCWLLLVLLLLFEKVELMDFF